MRNYYGLIHAADLSAALKEMKQREFEGWVETHINEITALGREITSHIDKGRIEDYHILTKDEHMWASLLHALGYDWKFQVDNYSAHYSCLTVYWKSNLLFDMTLPQSGNLLAFDILSRNCQISPTGTEEAKGIKTETEATPLAFCDMTATTGTTEATEKNAKEVVKENTKDVAAPENLVKPMPLAPISVEEQMKDNLLGRMQFQYLLSTSFQFKDIAIGGYFWVDNDVAEDSISGTQDMFIKLNANHISNALRLTSNSPFSANLYSFPQELEVKLGKLIN